jgi:hypothetical protein
MSTPAAPPAADEAVRAQLAAQAAAVAGSPSAGVYGGQAPVDLSSARAIAVDAQELLERLQRLEAQQAAAEAAANPPAGPPDNSILADSCAPGWLHQAFARIESRLRALEPAPAESE